MRVQIPARPTAARASKLGSLGLPLQQTSSPAHGPSLGRPPLLAKQHLVDCIGGCLFHAVQRGGVVAACFIVIGNPREKVHGHRGLLRTGLPAPHLPPPLPFLSKPPYPVSSQPNLFQRKGSDRGNRCIVLLANKPTSAPGRRCGKFWGLQSVSTAPSAASPLRGRHQPSTAPSHAQAAPRAGMSHTNPVGNFPLPSMCLASGPEWLSAKPARAPLHTLRTELAEKILPKPSFSPVKNNF